MAGNGEDLRIVRIVGGKGVFSQLTSLGLILGEPIQVVSSRGQGPMIIAVKGSRIFMGGGLAHKVIVQETLFERRVRRLQLV